MSGKLLENAFNWQSVEELKHALETKPHANLVNVHLLPLIPDSKLSRIPSTTLLSVYETDNKITSADVLNR